MKISWAHQSHNLLVCNAQCGSISDMHGTHTHMHTCSKGMGIGTGTEYTKNNSLSQQRKSTSLPIVWMADKCVIRLLLNIKWFRRPCCTCTPTDALLEVHIAVRRTHTIKPGFSWTRSCGGKLPAPESNTPLFYATIYVIQDFFPLYVTCCSLKAQKIREFVAGYRAFQALLRTQHMGAYKHTNATRTLSGSMYT